MDKFWQYVQRTGHPRKKTVQTDLPRQSTVESGTKPPKFSLIGSPCRIILVQRLFEGIELSLPKKNQERVYLPAPAADDTGIRYDYIHTGISCIDRDFFYFLAGKCNPNPGEVGM